MSAVGTSLLLSACLAWNSSPSCNHMQSPLLAKEVAIQTPSIVLVMGNSYYSLGWHPLLPCPEVFVSFMSSLHNLLYSSYNAINTFGSVTILLRVIINPLWFVYTCHTLFQIFRMKWSGACVSMDDRAQNQILASLQVWTPKALLNASVECSLYVHHVINTFFQMQHYM